MALAAGARLGPYEIQSAIGAGGMGEVYKAVDTRLSRTVAIKVLPPQFSVQPDMQQRFEREAKTIAGLTHPHICTLHDVGEDNGTHFLVMEYVEGETLADRVERGPLTVDEALAISAAILEALDQAHRQGIVHRDLKPANVMLTKMGAARSGSSQTPLARTQSSRVKLLDFGLAKWTAPEPAVALSAQPTRLDVTAQGTIVGTLQYMAPEQIEGREADSRTDVFAFGAVLYEMLTGRKAFEGKSQASLIGAIMKAEPRPVSHAQPLTPAVLEHVIARCLAKDPEERWQDAHSLRSKLQWIARSRAGDTPVAVSPRRQWIDLAASAAIAAILLVLSIPAVLYWRGSADPEAIQFRHTITGLDEGDFALSPDGQTIAFVAKPDSSAASSLYVRPVRGLTSVKLAGTDNATQPFWSPDSRLIAYVTGGKVKRVAAAGGAPQDICDARDVAGGAWSSAQGGTIFLGSPKGLLSVSAEGGQPVPVTELASGETGHLWPNVLPDDRGVLFLSWSDDAANRAIYAVSLESRERTKLVAAESNPMYAPSGSHAGSEYLFFRRQTVLFAQPFDAKQLRMSGVPLQIASEVSAGANGQGHFAVSRTGVLLYFQGGAGGTGGRGGASNAQFTWVRASGGLEAIAVEPGSYGDMDLSPDGRQIAITRQEPGATTADVWVIDWQKAVSYKLTAGAADALNPVWSPDGRQIAFTSFRKGNADVYVKNANGVGEETPLVESPADEWVEDWSQDGKYVALLVGREGFQDIYALPLESEKPEKPFVVVKGDYQKNEPQFSTDGKWLAYTSDENEPGHFQIYVISFPRGDLKQQISTEGGGQPRWSWDGKTLFYRGPNNRFMAADIRLGAAIESAVPREIGPPSSAHPTAADPTRHMWAVARDGRLLIRVPPGAGAGRAGGTAPVLAPQIVPTGQTAAAAGVRGPVTSGLTAIIHWTSALPKGSTGLTVVAEPRRGEKAP